MNLSRYITDYDSSEENKFIINLSVYLDPKNLYGYAMNQCLPYGEFKWLNQKVIDMFDVNLIEENSSNGYILEADLEHLDKLHNFHNDYPLAAEKLKLVMICCQNTVVTLLKNME